MSQTFADLGVPADLVRLLKNRGVTEPFPIQAATVPDALAGRDVCGKAPTGSGKTLAFGLAIATRLAAGSARPRRPRALVLVPTRELAAQVAGEIAALQTRRGQHVVAVYGGAGYGPQRKALSGGADVVVGCPGRLEDLMARGDISLADVEVVVLDEADRMADMGFLPAVRRILDQTAKKRQTLLFSATLDGDVETLVRYYQSNPVHHEVEGEDDDGEVTHHFWKAERAERTGFTAALVHHHGRAIVFCRTKRGADRVAKQLRVAGVEAAAIHGDRSQAQRERALAAFASGRVAALVATDVAARGIHVDDVACVVHFDLPDDPKDYVHRSGRTGRAGASGTVISFVTGEHRKTARALQRQLGLPETVTPGSDSVPAAPPAPTAPLVGHESRPEPTRAPKRPGKRSRHTPGEDRRDGAPARKRNRHRQPAAETNRVDPWSTAETVTSDRPARTRQRNRRREAAAGTVGAVGAAGAADGGPRKPRRSSGRPESVDARPERPQGPRKPGRRTGNQPVRGQWLARRTRDDEQDGTGARRKPRNGQAQRPAQASARSGRR